MAKKLDPQAKAKRQKVLAAVGGVLLLGVLAFQVPRTMKLLHQPNVADASSTTTTSGTETTSGPIAPPTLAGGNATPAASAASGNGVADPGIVVAPQSGQLLAFSRFRTKDPFAQQLNVNCAEDSAGCGSTGTTAPSGATGRTRTGAPGTAPKPTTTRPAPSKPTSAVIAVNGNSESVAVGARFPASNPTFVLVSLTRKSAQIGIAGGSLESGGKTVTLKKGTPLTLMNTADGTRYVLRLLSVA